MARCRSPVTVTEFSSLFSKKYGPMILQLKNAHQTVTFCGCSGFSTVFLGFSQTQMWQFCFITNPPRWKWPSSLKIIFCKKIIIGLSWFVHSIEASNDQQGSALVSIEFCRDKSFVKIGCSVVGERFNSCARWWIEVSGYLATLALHQCCQLSGVNK